MQPCCIGPTPPSSPSRKSVNTALAPPTDQTPIAIFDTVVTYHPEVLDPTLAGEGFAVGSSTVSVAQVDLRSQ